MKAPFHGEFSIDSESGAILRLTMQADLPPRLPLDESNIIVESGPVNIGGKITGFASSRTPRPRWSRFFAPAGLLHSLQCPGFLDALFPFDATPSPRSPYVTMGRTWMGAQHCEVVP